MTSLNHRNPKLYAQFTMAMRGRSGSATPGVAPATVNSLPSRTTKQLTSEEFARMANPLQPIAEQVTPPYDRNADIVWYRGVESNPEDDFIRSLPDLKFRRNKQQGRMMIFFKRVPLSIRRRIYAYVYEHPADGKMVNLSKDFTTKDVFPPDFFIAPWDLLQHAQGALSACVQMRDELYTYFWNTYHFHVTFSPYSIGPVFSGLSIRLLNAYASRVNHLTVEVDMTKLAFSAAKDAKLLKQNNKKLQKVLVNLVIALGRRRFKGNIMASLTLLVRRYQGFRPAPTDAPEDKEVPYCPDKALYVFDCFCELKPLVLQCRMSGFPIWYTRQLLKEILIPPFLTKPRPAPIIPAWPNYLPTPPEVVYLSNINTVDTAGNTSCNTPGSIAGSTSGSVDMPGFRTTIPSFGYSQASSSAGSLVPLNVRTIDFYQSPEDSSEESHKQGSGHLCNTSASSPLNPCTNNAENNQWTGSNAQWIGSNTPVKSYKPMSSGNSSSVAASRSIATTDFAASPSLMENLRPGAIMTDDTGIPIVSDDDRFTPTPSSTSTGRMTVRSFGTPRSITAPKSGIPVPRQGTNRLFMSRHGYTVTESGSRTPDRFGGVALGLGIALDSNKSLSFADEIDAEMSRRRGPSLPPRKDSLPGGAKSPNTIDELNEMNEMDPAFTRAVEGLRMASDSKEKDAEYGEVGEAGSKDDAADSGKKDKKREKSKKKKQSRKHWF